MQVYKSNYNSNKNNCFFLFSIYINTHCKTDIKKGDNLNFEKKSDKTNDAYDEVTKTIP